MFQTDLELISYLNIGDLCLMFNCSNLIDFIIPKNKKKQMADIDTII